MKFSQQAAIAVLALQAAAAPIEVEKRQGFGNRGSFGGLSGSGSGSGLRGLGSSTSGSSSGFGGLSGFSGLGSSNSGSSSGLTGLSGPSGFGTSTPGSSSGLSGLGTATPGSSGLGSTGTGSGGSTSTGTSTSTQAASGDSASGGSSSGGCRAVTLIFARGTGELGTLGTVIGSPLATALASALGSDKVTAEGVNYPADAAGNSNLGASGGRAMASQAQAALSSCPDTKLVLGGYSQGAMAVHNALSAQGLDGSKVAAVVAFGDPFNGQKFDGVDASRVKEFCGSADFLCSSGGTTGSGSHLDYRGSAEAAAQFIVSVVGS